MRTRTRTRGPTGAGDGLVDVAVVARVGEGRRLLRGGGGVVGEGVVVGG